MSACLATDDYFLLSARGTPLLLCLGKTEVSGVEVRIIKINTKHHHHHPHIHTKTPESAESAESGASRANFQSEEIFEVAARNISTCHKDFQSIIKIRENVF